MARQYLHPSTRRTGRRPVRTALGACATSLVLVAMTGSAVSAQSSEGTVEAGCQGFAGGPDGPPLGPVSNQPDVTVTFTHPESATEGTAFEVSVDFAGWMNAVFPVAADDNSLIVTLDLTGATEPTVEIIAGPPGVSAAPNVEFDVPMATASITPSGSDPVTVSIASWAVDNFGAGVYIECTLQSGSASAEIPVEAGDGTSPTTAPPTLAATGVDTNVLVLVATGLCGLGLAGLIPGLRRRPRHGETTVG